PGTVVYPQVKMDSYLAIKLGLWTDGMASDWPRPEDVGEVVGIDAGLLAARAPGLPDAGPSPLYLRYADAALPGQVKSVLPARTPLPKQGSPDGDLTDAEAASEVGQ
ncbi:MAG: hypothetical protein FWF43_09790, partial [Propionibacteriaceae bacterium]|nr:hypothetical protein [Propionibacteriaceae bacterium]